MARRRFQNPKLQLRGNWWTIRVWQDVIGNGVVRRSYKRIRLAPATMKQREAQKVAAEYMQPLNQGLGGVLSATNFQRYIEQTYTPLEMPLLAKSTQDRYQGVIDHYLIPSFGPLCLRDLTPMTLQQYLSGLATSKLAHGSRAKIRTVLGAILGTATRKYHLLVTNPMEGLSLPPERTGKRRSKPYLTPVQFGELLARISEPYATMVYVAIYTGLRVSELAGLRWNDLGDDTITIDERFCRGDWGSPKSESSNATIPVNRSVIERIHRMKLLTVEVKAGRAVRKYRIVKSDKPNDLVFTVHGEFFPFGTTMSLSGPEELKSHIGAVLRAVQLSGAGRANLERSGRTPGCEASSVIAVFGAGEVPVLQGPRMSA